MEKKKMLFHQENASCHKTMKTIAKLYELHFKLLPYPPDLAPSDLYRLIKITECKRSVIVSLLKDPTDFSADVLFSLFTHCDRTIST